MLTGVDSLQLPASPVVQHDSFGKRKNVEEVGPESKRPCASSASNVTFSTLLQIRSQISPSTSIKLTVFVGLCTYLEALLDRGYLIDENKYDLFITRYTTFKDTTRHFPTEVHTSGISYHTWFSSHGGSVATPSNIITRNVLTSIRLENPYSFRLTCRRLDNILHQNIDTL